MEKIFCIGFNKTGTTSLACAFRDMGFKVAPQHTSELLMKDVKDDRWETLIGFCKQPYNFYQDIPFSLPNVYKILHSNFPNAKFVLLTRNSSSWYDSICRFHKLHFAKQGQKTTMHDLKSASYQYPGLMWDYYEYTFHPKNNGNLYNERELRSAFEKHNKEVTEYFKNNQNFISINVSNSGDYERLYSFLNLDFSEAPRKQFPHLNGRST